MSKRTRRPPAIVLVAASLGLAMVTLPVVGLVQRAEWSGLWSDLTSGEAVSALRLSLYTSVLASLAAVALGTPLAWVLARADLPGRALLRGLVLLPMVLPPVVGGVALLAAFSLRSPLGRWLHDVLGIQLTFSTAGAVMAATFVALPFYVITLETGLRGVDQRLEQAAAVLGAGPLRVFTRITLPLVAPSLVAGAVLAWARALGEFGATITFAGNIEGVTRTVPLAIYLELERDPEAAYALSLVLLAVSLAVLAALRGRWLVRA